MKKIFLMIGLLIIILATTILAQPRQSGQDEVIQKLDQILQNQAVMMDYLKFIKNRSR